MRSTRDAVDPSQRSPASRRVTWPVQRGRSRVRRRGMRVTRLCGRRSTTSACSSSASWMRCPESRPATHRGRNPGDGTVSAADSHPHPSLHPRAARSLARRVIGDPDPTLIRGLSKGRLTIWHLRGDGRRPRFCGLLEVWCLGGALRSRAQWPGRVGAAEAVLAGSCAP
jgi:hypothetical protein